MDFEKLADLLEEELGVERERITLNSKLKDDLEADSLDLFELITQLEEECNITIDEEDYEKLVTVQDIINYVNSKK